MNARTLGAAALLALTSVASWAEMPAPEATAAKYEIRFMEDMIDHHAMAVMTAEMCLDKAVHPELRTLCETIIATQTQEIEMMQSWLSSWYGITYMPEMTMTGQMKKLASLSGAEFEIEFMQMMIRHHLGAIREASHCVERAYHADLQSLCEDIITAQAAEIEMMREWLCEWYGICR